MQINTNAETKIHRIKSMVLEQVCTFPLDQTCLHKIGSASVLKCIRDSRGRKYIQKTVKRLSHKSVAQPLSQCS